MGTNLSYFTAKNTCSFSSEIWSIANTNIYRRRLSLFITAKSNCPHYNQLVSMMDIQGVRPNMPEYPQIAIHVREAINQVYNGTKEPEEALDEAAAKSAKVLGW